MLIRVENMTSNLKMKVYYIPRDTVILENASYSLFLLAITYIVLGSKYGVFKIAGVRAGNLIRVVSGCSLFAGNILFISFLISRNLLFTDSNVGATGVRGGGVRVGVIGSFLAMRTGVGIRDRGLLKLRALSRCCWIILL